MKKIENLIKNAIQCEMDSITHFQKNLDPNIYSVVELLSKCNGNIIVTGVGKSGDIAKKISSTLTSTGTPALFLHPTDASHGDLGLVRKDDIVICIGKSGESEELNSILPTIRTIGAKIIGITSNVNSQLAKNSDIVIEMPVLKEACPLELAPTSSTTISLILGDAIAMALMELKNFKKENFALFHPSGRLGKRLSLKVEDVMRKGNNCPIVNINANFEKIISVITEKFLGSTLVSDEKNQLLGIITDFDIRKVLKNTKEPKNILAKEMLNPNPVKFFPHDNAFDVLLKMENREFPVNVAPIVGEKNQILGLVSIHDLLSKGLK